NALAARHSPQGQILRDWYGRRPSDTARRAFLFGALAHILEMDDLHRESVTHPGCAVVPAAWAIAVQQGSGGHDFLRAVLAGYEAVCRIGNAVGRAHYAVWHNTSTCGPYGAAVAAAMLLELREEPTVWAMGNAGTQSAGLWQFLEEGAMSKHLHAGRAAEAGVLAAELAARGFTGPAEILEGRKGFFVAACPDAAPERVLAEPGAAWQLRLTSIKPWPSCRHTHPVVDAALELHGRVEADAIAEVRIETYQAALALCDAPAPTSEYEAKFSLQHCAAAALSDGALTLNSFDGSARTRLAALAARSTPVAVSHYESAYPDRWGARVTLRTAAGETLSADRPACKGDPESPLTPNELRAKANTLLAHGGFTKERATSLIDAVLALPHGGELPDVAQLVS
ncbi:MAG TPA: MmgE/PrpD family protein, partial [Gammaproteobacteria bacterium]|nr:MmgE/PrpD family protein [Gammaproteobacteria bacterium]